MANHSGPESCVTPREVCGEALTGETGRPAIEPRIQQSGMPTRFNLSEGNMGQDDNRKSCPDPARSEICAEALSNGCLYRDWRQG